MMKKKLDGAVKAALGVCTGCGSVFEKPIDIDKSSEDSWDIHQNLWILPCPEEFCHGKVLIDLYGIYQSGAATYQQVFQPQNVQPPVDNTAKQG